VTQSLRRNRNFVLLSIGQGLSDTGSGASALAYPLLVLAVSHSPTLAGVVGTVAAAVGLAGRLPSGALADRYDRRVVMIGCDVVRGIAVVGVVIAALTHHVAWPVILVVASVDSFGGVLFDAASSALMPMFVPDEQLEGAWAATQARGQAASIAGPPLGGALFAVSRSLPFIADAVSYTVSIATLAGLRGRFRTVKAAETPDATTKTGMHREIGEGFRYIWRTPLLRAFIMLAPLINFAYAGVAFTVPVALRVHGVRADVIGAVLASLSVAALLGAVLSPKIARRIRLPWLMVGMPGMSTVLFTIAAVVVPSPFVALPLLGVGLLAPAANTALLSRMGREVPEHMMGRVISNIQFCGSALGVAAPLAAGLLVSQLNGHVSIAVFAGADLVAAVIALTQWRVWSTPRTGGATSRLVP
jgi:MFS family permease